MSPVMNIWAKRVLWSTLSLVGVAAIIWAFMPRPVPVDIGEVNRGPLRVTVDEDGRTRVTDRYTVTAALAGHVERLTLQEGDFVRDGDVIARISPVAPPLLDARTRQQAEARVAAARAAVRQTRAARTRAQRAFEFARDEATRHERLLESGVVTSQAAERAQLSKYTAAADLASARFSVAVAENELEVARAALSTMTDDESAPSDVMVVTAPVDSHVLEILHESEGVVQMGTPLVELGDLSSLEVVVDVLTTDAVTIEQGDPVRLVRWGGGTSLDGRVRRVEPSAFTKVSSLGVEEQRVNVIIDFTDPPEQWSALGDGFRVEAEIVVWQQEDVLQVDASAVFRARDGWAVFRISEGSARLTPVSVGRRTERAVQILDGLHAGDEIVLYPTDAVDDGVDVEPREEAGSR